MEHGTGEAPPTARGGERAPAGPASSWVVRFTHLLPAGGTALDLAAGNGRHTRVLRAAGMRVAAVDRDVSGLADLTADPFVDVVAADLEDGRRLPLPGRRFDAVVVTNYLHRPLLAGIVASVGPGGVLLYETFGVRQARFGRPVNPAFLLEPGELLDVVRPALHVVAFEDVLLEGPRAVQRVAAVGALHRASPAS